MGGPWSATVWATLYPAGCTYDRRPESGWWQPRRPSSRLVSADLGLRSQLCLSVSVIHSAAMQRPALRSVTRTAVPARPTPPSTVPLSFRTRPSPSSAPPSKHRHYASAACPPPLAHPTRPHAPVQATTPNKRYGQPLPSTHPHLLAPGQLTPGISATEYETRRRKLVDRLDDDAVVVIAGGRTVYSSQNILHVLAVSLALSHACRRCAPKADSARSRETHSYRFRQRSNFWYLTGFEEPDSALIIGALPPSSSPSPLARG